MKQYRYGKFMFRDYCASWVGMSILLLFSIAGIVVDVPLFFAVLPVLYSLVWICSILIPYCEQFVLYEDSIEVSFGKTSRSIPLPSELTLVVSYVDICPPLAQRTAIEKQTHILTGKFAVSVLRKMPLDVVLEKLHANRLLKYTTSTIRMAFDGHYYVYGFVCESNMIEKLISNRNCLLIVPKSLLQKLSVNLPNADVYVDEKC